LFGEPAVAKHRDARIAGREIRHARAAHGHDALDLVTRREGQKQPELVLVLDHQQLRELHARSLHAYAHFPRSTHLRRNHYHHEVARSSVRLAQYRAHETSSSPDQSGFLRNRGGRFSRKARTPSFDSSVW